MGEKLLKVDEVAKELDVHKYTVYDLLNSGKLPGIRINTHWRVRREDLDKFTTAHAIAEGGELNGLSGC